MHIWKTIHVYVMIIGMVTTAQCLLDSAIQTVLNRCVMDQRCVIVTIATETLTLIITITVYVFLNTLDMLVRSMSEPVTQSAIIVQDLMHVTV